MIDCTSAGLSKYIMMVVLFSDSGKETPLFDVGRNSRLSFPGRSIGFTTILSLVGPFTACISSQRFVVMVVSVLVVAVFVPEFCSEVVPVGDKLTSDEIVDLPDVVEPTDIPVVVRVVETTVVSMIFNNSPQFFPFDREIITHLCSFQYML